MSPIERIRLAGELAKLLAEAGGTSGTPISRMKAAARARVIADQLRGGLTEKHAKRIVEAPTASEPAMTTATETAQLFNREGTPRTPNTEQGTYRYKGVCGRCGGTGQYAFNLMHGTRCFSCWGEKTQLVEEKLYTADKLAAMNARKAAKEAKIAAKIAAEIAERDAARPAFVAAHADVLAQVDRLIADEAERLARRNVDRDGEKDPFWSNYKAEFVDRLKPMPDKMRQAISEAIERLDVREAEKARVLSAGHLGEVGERIKGVKVKVVGQKHIATISRFPTIERWLVKLQSEQGHELTWWTGGPTGYEDGTEVEAAMTIKEHGEFAGKPQTTVQRVAFKDPPAQD